MSPEKTQLPEVRQPNNLEVVFGLVRSASQVMEIYDRRMLGTRAMQDELATEVLRSAVGTLAKSLELPSNFIQIATLRPSDQADKESYAKVVVLECNPISGELNRVTRSAKLNSYGSPTAEADSSLSAIHVDPAPASDWITYGDRFVPAIAMTNAIRRSR